MKGTIKFVDSDGGFGFIIPADESADAHFPISEFIGPCPRANEKDRPVEFEFYRDGKGAHAVRIRLLDSKETDLPPWANPSALRRALTLWADLPRPFTQPYTKDLFPSAMHRLAAITLRETWHFGSEPPHDQPYPILWNYLCFTFVHHCKQDTLKESPPEQANLRVSADGAWAAFNTGLVNELYDPVFALFQRGRNRSGPPWKLFDFCVPGQERAGTDLAGAFNPLPEPPKYFKSSLDMLLDPDQPINIGARHTIVDAIRRDRFPYEFLRQNFQPRPPQGVEWEDYSSYENIKREAYLKKIASAV